jgi:uncharacterized protein (PEP-CTERM system associated)
MSRMQLTSVLAPRGVFLSLGRLIFISGAFFTITPSHGQLVEQNNGVAGERFISIVPSLSIDGLWSDNIRPQIGSTGASDFVTTIRPGIRFMADGDRLKAQVDYSLSRFFHARDKSLDRNQNSLRGVGTYEVAEGFAFVDVSGAISQQNISAFGARSNDDATYNPNRTEVSTYRISPYVLGQLGDWASYQARYSWLTSRTKAGSAFDYDSGEWSAVLSSRSGGRAFSWSADVNHQQLDYTSGRSFESDRLRVQLTYPVTPQFSLSFIPGWESNNYASQEKEGHSTLGGKIDWIASDRTRLSALVEKRFFGRAHVFNFEHRTPRTAWRASDSRDANVTPNQLGTANLGPLYDLLFFQFASIEPDPARRAQLVQSYLDANGLDPNTSVNIGFLTSAASLVRRQDLSFTLLGLRDTLTFLASRSESSRLLQGVGGNDDLGSSMFVRSNGFSILYSRRLTPQSSLSALLSQTKSTGEFAGLQNSKLRSLNISVSTRLGKNTSATLGLRRSISGGNQSSYTESAVRGGISVQY